MLLEQLHEAGPGRVVVRVRDQAVSGLLEAILREWRYLTEPGPTRLTVALVEPGLPAPEGAGHTLWLSTHSCDEKASLALPLSLAVLYQALQVRFYPVPRRYLRLTLDLPAHLEFRGTRLSGRLVSLSERGGRVACARPLPKGAPLQVDVNLGGYPLQLMAEVIYCIPAGDLPGGKDPHQTGLLFRPLDPAVSRGVHRFVERTLIERVCARTGVDLGDPALQWFDTVGDPWAKI